MKKLKFITALGCILAADEIDAIKGHSKSVVSDRDHQLNINRGLSEALKIKCRHCADYRKLFRGSLIVTLITVTSELAHLYL